MSQDHPSSEGSTQEEEGARIPLAHRFRILVVDDEEDLLSILAEQLKRGGYRVVDTAVDGLEALEKTQKAMREGDRYDIIISDWKMPNLTGIEFLERLRKNPFYEKTPFILLTSVDEEEKVRQAVLAGVTDYIVKPFLFKIVAQRLAAINKIIP